MVNMIYELLEIINRQQKLIDEILPILANYTGIEAEERRSNVEK